jgi:hypothetical protein
MISGFLVLQDASGKTSYARTGQFAVDNDGFITLRGTKLHLAVLDSSNQAVALNIDSKRTNPPKATEDRITNFMGYNTSNMAPGKRKDPADYWTGDLMLECKAKLDGPAEARGGVCVHEGATLNQEGGQIRRAGIEHTEAARPPIAADVDCGAGFKQDVDGGAVAAGNGGEQRGGAETAIAQR